MRIATLNINSIRIRLPLLKEALRQTKADIFCLQETKASNEVFPLEDVRALGFDHVAFSGQKSYNGVAILSRVPLKNIHTHDLLKNDEKRHIAAQLPDGTWLHNFYVPAGGDIPDPKQNPKFRDKLAFVAAMHDWSQSLASKDKVILVGDLNIAPLEHDVWSHKQLLDVVSHTPVETEAMGRLRQSQEWVDAAREFTPASQKLYSWWSYRNRDWRTSNRGRRLDHIWLTPNLKKRLRAVQILKDLRDHPSPSDHVPVVAEIA